MNEIVGLPVFLGALILLAGILARIDPLGFKEKTMTRYWCAGGCGQHFDADPNPYSLVVNCTHCGSYKTRIHVDPALRIPYRPAWWELQEQRQVQSSEMLYADPDWKNTQ